ncbi:MULTISPECIES: hypothetical protein [unclassified Streptomyces]|uniref:hypothetical protein n=1 Tax=unclassified Streptomyces TaxID=2593676 RepID=UPI00073B465D|nr:MULTISPECIES: hypothetical protein [unclassified Streptomyces]MCX2926284.1 hypothetical protein [Streptomyces sp. NEAU-W12]ODA69223.1 hypothetical protein APS67_006614 [Streptomyces sp. AVP053U2]
MNGWLEPAAVLITAGGVLSAVAAYRMVRSAGSAVAVLLDFLVAAGLVRLAGDLSWDGILLAAALIALRKLISVGLAVGRRGGVPVPGVPNPEVQR